MRIFFDTYLLTFHLYMNFYSKDVDIRNVKLHIIVHN